MLIETTDLHCERDDRVLFSALNLKLASGIIHRIEGANGMGKTTLLRILAGLYTGYEGELRYSAADGDYVSASEISSQLLFIGHSSGIKTSLTPRENLQWYARLHGNALSAIETALQRVSLAGFEHVPCHKLSAGQQRRVALARLFLQPASLWLLDEPFTAIDKQGVLELEGWMTRHVADGGCVVMTTHQALQAHTSVNSIHLRPAH